MYSILCLLMVSSLFFFVFDKPGQVSLGHHCHSMGFWIMTLLFSLHVDLDFEARLKLFETTNQLNRSAQFICVVLGKHVKEFIQGFRYHSYLYIACGSLDQKLGDCHV